MELNGRTKFSDVDIQKAPLLHETGLGRDIGRTLIVAPHPDDEVLGCGGLISLLRNQDTEVHVVFMTNGDASHPNSNIYDAHKLGQLRKSEAISSCDILGVKEKNVHFIELSDSKVHEQSKEKEKVVFEQFDEIFKRCDFDSIVTTWRRDAHSDHRATYHLCRSYIDATNRSIQFIEYPIWLWKNGQSKDWPESFEIEPFRLEIKQVYNTKISAIRQHKSQTTRLIDDDPEGFILTEELLEPFTTDFEYYFFTPSYTQKTLQGEYFNRLYADADDPWGFKTSHYERKKYLKTLEYLKYYRFKTGLEIGCSIGEHSKLLTRCCDHLTAIDINAEAIFNAKKKYEGEHIDFKVWNASEGLPDGEFDLITLCEVGYYMSETDLIDVYRQIDKKIRDEGMLLSVHWTPYVREYPLTGRKVHEIFERLNVAEFNYIKKSNYTHAYYELLLWQKSD